jgi:chromosome partitioning protein
VALSIAVVGVKGGVGKTTTAVNLAGLAASGGLRTLVWDLDPQGAASYALGFDKRGKGATRHVTKKRPDLDDAVFRTVTPGLDLIPADISLRTLDLELARRARSRRRVGDALASIVDDYDVVLIDCPAGITLANEGAMRAAQVYLAPVVPSALSVRAFEQLVTYVAESRKADGQLMGFLSMVDLRKRGHRELAQSLPRDHPQILHASVPASAAVEAAPQQGTPFVFTRRKSRVAIAYRNLWTEIQTSAFGRHIDMTAEDRDAAHARRGARPPRRPSPRLSHRPT